MDQLPSYPCAKLKLDQFFLQWLSEHQDVVGGANQRHEQGSAACSVQQHHAAARGDSVRATTSWAAAAGWLGSTPPP